MFKLKVKLEEFLKTNHFADASLKFGGLLHETFFVHFDKLTIVDKKFMSITVSIINDSTDR